MKILVFGSKNIATTSWVNKQKNKKVSTQRNVNEKIHIETEEIENCLPTSVQINLKI